MRQKRIIGRLGDVNFPEYDGGLVYRTPYGVELEYVDWYSDDENLAAVGSYDVPEPHKWRNEWWAKDIKGIASSTGETVEELEAQLDSKDPVKRAAAIYYSVRGYTNLDSDELQLSRKEVMKRYARSGPRRKRQG
jgi:hypothetical protein